MYIKFIINSMYGIYKIIYLILKVLVRTAIKNKRL